MEVKYLRYRTRVDQDTGRPANPEERRKVFISYKHSDEEQLPICEKLADIILKQYDVAVWRDLQLTAGREYDEEIREAILHSDVFVLLLTPHILESDYIWQKEVALAKEKYISVIPVIAGLDKNDLPEVEKKVGKIHMPAWFFGAAAVCPGFPYDSHNQLMNGIGVSIAAKDILEQAKQFYNKGLHHVSLCHLRTEEIFLKAYGALYGAGDVDNKELASKLMQSISNTYGEDEEFLEFREKVTEELLNYLYRSDQPELLLRYLRIAYERKYICALKILDSLYYNNGQPWHPEILAAETDISMMRFNQCFNTPWTYKIQYPHFLEEFQEMIRQFGNQPDREFPPCPDNGKPHIGELHFNGHIAYLRLDSMSDQYHAEVSLIVDGMRVDSDDLYGSCGDSACLFLAYDSEHDLLYKFYTEFDHYEVENCTDISAYRVLDSNRIRCAHCFMQDRGRIPVPYGPTAFTRYESMSGKSHYQNSSMMSRMK